MNTVYDCLSALESAFIIDRFPRNDLVGKDILKPCEKKFVGGQAIIYSVMDYKVSRQWCYPD